MTRIRRFRDVRSSYRWILKRVAAGLAQLGFELRPAGTSDLTWGQRKVSGNAQQRKRTHLLHHGSLLYDFDIAQAERYLRHAPPGNPSIGTAGAIATFSRMCLPRLPIFAAL